MSKDPQWSIGGGEKRHSKVENKSRLGRSPPLVKIQLKQCALGKTDHVNYFK